MKKFIFVFSFVCSVAESAQLVGNEITLCTNGYSADGSTCTTYSDGDCGTGYHEITPSATTFVSSMNGTCSASGYRARTLPDTTISLVYHGAVIGDEISLCTNGYSPNGSTCSTYSRGDCDSNYHEITPSATSFVSSMNGTCSASGYRARTLPDTTISLVYHGAVIGDELTLCANGYSADGSTCTTYGSTNCPTGFYNVNVGSASFAENNGSCASGYTQYIAEASCGFDTSGSVCINFCGNGELMTGTGGCSALCGQGATVFRTSTGLRFPLWATKQTTPSLNVGFANGNRCYVSLTSDPTTEQSVWVQWGNNKMHTTK